MPHRSLSSPPRPASPATLLLFLAAHAGLKALFFSGAWARTVALPLEFGTGGLVTRHTVGEQMMYEVLDPENYILPDVVLDLSGVTLEQVHSRRL